MIPKTRQKELMKDVDRGIDVLGYVFKSIYMWHGFFHHMTLEQTDYREEVNFITEYLHQQVKEKMLDAEETAFD